MPACPSSAVSIAFMPANATIETKIGIASASSARTSSQNDGGAGAARCAV